VAENILAGSSTILIRKENVSENLTGECMQDHASHSKKTCSVLVKISLPLRLSVTIKQEVVW
jgi:uncharacterized protein YqfB (UPF0267 family)